jgi:LysR family transcriptional regulator of gallate degradation
MAAQETHAAQSALTYAIKCLEERFDRALLLRSSKGCSPTREGEIVAVRTRRFSALLERAVAEFVDREERAVSTARQLTLAQILAVIAMDKLVRPQAAAASLGITENALLRRIREVELAVGRTIFARSAGCFITMDEALGLVGGMTLAHRELDFALGEISSDTTSDRPVVIVGCVGLARSELMPKVISEFSASHPEATMQVHHESFSVLYRRLRFGEIDFLVGSERDDVDADIVESRFLYEDEYVLLCRNGHPLERSDVLCLRKLFRYDWIMPLGSRRIRQTISRAAGMGPEAIRVTLETPSTTTSWALLIESDRLMLSSAGAVDACLQGENIHVLPYRLPLPRRRVMLYSRRGAALPATQRDFVGITARVAAGRIVEADTPSRILAVASAG